MDKNVEQPKNRILKILTYTCDPYEPSGVVGVFETNEELRKILIDLAEQDMKDGLVRKKKRELINDNDIAKLHKRHNLEIVEIEFGVGKRWC